MTDFGKDQYGEEVQGWEKEVVMVEVTTMTGGSGSGSSKDPEIPVTQRTPDHYHSSRGLRCWHWQQQKRGNKADDDDDDDDDNDDDDHHDDDGKPLSVLWAPNAERPLHIHRASTRRPPSPPGFLVLVH